jgi:DNA polymerase (family 10)
MTDAHPPVPLADALVAASAIVAEGVSCGAFKRTEIAGSIRRGKEHVHDIEIVTEEGDYFGGVPAFLSSIGVVRGPPNKAGAKAPWGPKYYKGILSRGRIAGTQLDLFVVTPPAQWGVVFLIRTGSAEFSQAVVTRLRRYGLRSEDGRIVDLGNKTIPVDSEEDVFERVRLPYVPPEKRDMGIPETRALFDRP